jgi:transposase InsO family protein
MESYIKKYHREDGKNMTDEEKLEIGLFRYGLIHPLMQEGLPKGEKMALVRDILSKTYEIPGSGRMTISERTLFVYCKCYRKGGFPALLPEERKDAGNTRIIPDDVLKKAFELKEELPERSVREIIAILELSGNVPEGLLKNSTLSRVMSNNIKAAITPKTKSAKILRRFQKENVNDTWQSDIKYCIYLKNPKDPKEYIRTYLVCFLDDRSRKVCGKIYFEENAQNVEDCFRKAIVRMGIPTVFYTDNAQVYRTKRLKVICAELGCLIKYCRPYTPTSKGKVEKFNSYVDRSFEPEARKLGIETLDELNEYFEYWLSENYNNKKHSSIGATPEEIHAADKTHVKYISPEKLRGAFIQHLERKANKTATVSIEGNLYKLEGVLANKKVQLRFDKKDLANIEVYYNGQQYKNAEPLLIKNNVWDGENTVEASNKAAEESELKTSYLKLLKEKYEKKLKDKANRLNFSSLYSKEEVKDV